MIAIPLTRGLTALLDDCDADLAGQRWCAHSDGYAVRAFQGRTQRMHRVVLARLLGRALAAHEQVDHVNGVRTDNRRTNLRLATAAENRRNMRRGSRNTSGYKGVHPHRLSGKWRACIGHRHLGLFATPEAAAEAYRAAAIAAFGEFARFDEPAPQL